MFLLLIPLRLCTTHVKDGNAIYIYVQSKEIQTHLAILLPCNVVSEHSSSQPKTLFA